MKVGIDSNYIDKYLKQEINCEKFVNTSPKFHNEPICPIDISIDTYVTDPSMSYQLNRDLRNSKPLLYPLYKLAKGLDSLFYTDSKYLEYPAKVYRGVSYIDFDEHKDKLEEFKNIVNCTSDKAVFIDNAYVSTSTSFEVAKKFAGENGVVLEINLPAGTKFIDVAKLFSKSSKDHRFARKESEWLLPRGSKFKVVEPTDANGVVKLEYMGEVFPKEALKSRF